MIGLGSKVKDSITGFTGIVIASTDWLHGCRRLGVQSQELKDGKTVEAEWFDEQRLEVITEDKIKISKDSSAGPGGHRNDPSYRSIPKR